MQLSLDAAVEIPEHVVYRTFVSETVLLNLETGKYHGLNESAGRMLDVIGACATLREAASRLATDYGRDEDEIAADLVGLCEQLVGRGLLSVREHADG